MTKPHSHREFREDYGVQCCPHVFGAARPVLLVVRRPDGAWQFRCGQSDDTQARHRVAVGELLERDPTLGDMVHLDLASGAHRGSRGDAWDYFRVSWLSRAWTRVAEGIVGLFSTPYM